MNAEAAVEAILEAFEGINRIPRKSKHEARIAAYLAAWADEQGFEHQSDPAGNLVIRVSASEGREGEPCVILQGHMDMVCEKSPGSDHDFATDPIESFVDGEWLKARDTTLGADNGIAIAMSMVAAMSMSHPPLELLFTVDEETGLTGARNLDGALLTGRQLINLDSEDEGVITIGCAGGCDSVVTLPVERANEPPSSATVILLTVGGLRGGHSGVDIDTQRGNANQILGRVLDRVIKTDSLFGFATISGGSARNAIPRDASVELIIAEQDRTEVDQAVAEVEKTVREELTGVDDGVFIACEPSAPRNVLYTVESLRRVADLLISLPSGVHRMSTTVEGLVETSNNLAVCSLQAGRYDAGTDATTDVIVITSSQRSSVNTKIDELNARITAIARMAGAAVRQENAYPAWPARSESPLLELAKTVHRERFGREAVIEIIHAGLECAVIGASIEDIDMISIGPTIERAHSPEERLHVPSVGVTWEYLEGLLAEGVT